MRKRLVVLLLAGVMLVLCSCGKKDMEPTAPATTEAPRETEPVTTQIVESEPDTLENDGENFVTENYESVTKENFTGYFQGKIMNNSNNVLEKDVSDKDSERVLLYNFVEYPVLEGDSEAVKKINAYYDYRKNPLSTSGAAEYVPWDYEEGRFEGSEVYSDYTQAHVVLNTDKYFSMAFYYEWYAGGVVNNAYYGDTFDSQTGEHLSIADFYGRVSGLSADETKNKIVACSEEYVLNNPDEGEELVTAIKGYEPSEYMWVIAEDGTIYVTLGPYEAGYGGWYRAIPIDKIGETIQL